MQRSYDFCLSDGEEVTKYNTTKLRSKNICLDLSLRKVCGGKRNERDMMVNGSLEYGQFDFLLYWEVGVGRQRRIDFVIH